MKLASLLAKKCKNWKYNSLKSTELTSDSKLQALSPIHAKVINFSSFLYSGRNYLFLLKSILKLY